eukprot:14625269-Alexandrium_andersonii.AAC.1
MCSPSLGATRLRIRGGATLCSCSSFGRAEGSLAMVRCCACPVPILSSQQQRLHSRGSPGLVFCLLSACC